METKASNWSRWRTRRSTPFSRTVWILVFLAGFLAAFVFGREWADATHPRFVENFRPAYGVILAGVYWAIPILLWGLIYPGDGRLIRWNADAPRSQPHAQDEETATA